MKHIDLKGVSETADAPRRVQLSRAKGWRMPPNTVKVDRGTKWGNPWRTDRGSGGNPWRVLRTGCGVIFCCETQIEAVAEAVSQFHWLCLRPSWSDFLKDIQVQLRGKNLACWCALDAPCHADVLLELANRPTCERVEP